MRGALRTHVVAFDGASEALADGGALHINLLPNCKHLADRHRRTSAELSRNIGRHTKFLDDFASFYTGFGQMSGGRLADSRGLSLTERHLQGDIAIILLGFDLGHAVVRYIQHRDRDCVPLVGE